MAALPIATLNGNSLPYNFYYTPLHRKRMAIEDTITQNVVQFGTYYTGDEYWDFNCDGMSNTLKEALETIFENGTTVTFVDYRSGSYSVIITEWSTQPETGLWNVRGKMKRIP
jgi:hypothetical protein